MRVFYDIRKSPIELFIFIILILFGMCAAMYLVHKAYKFDTYYEIKTEKKDIEELAY